MGWELGDNKGQEGKVTNGHKKTFGCDGFMSIILTVVRVPRVYTNATAFQTVHLKLMSFIVYHLNKAYASMKLLINFVKFYFNEAVNKRKGDQTQM